MKGVAISISMIAMLAVVQIMVMVQPGQATITCGQVDGFLAPCVSYLIHGGDVPASCCSGIKSLTGLATNTEDKKAACACAKEAATRNPSLNEDNAKVLPTKCNVKMDIPISRTTDCGSIKF